jgi:hypothetical protein
VRFMRGSLGRRALCQGFLQIAQRWHCNSSKRSSSAIDILYRRKTYDRRCLSTLGTRMIIFAPACSAAGGTSRKTLIPRRATSTACRLRQNAASRRTYVRLVERSTCCTIRPPPERLSPGPTTRHFSERHKFRRPPRALGGQSLEIMCRERESNWRHQVFQNPSPSSESPWNRVLFAQ